MKTILHRCRVIVLPALAVSLMACAAAHAVPLRVMAIGDSITAGYTDNPNWTVDFEFGYRSRLYQRLTTAGYDIQMVGSSTEPWVSTFPGDPSRGGTYTPPLDLRPLGQDHHRGYGGVAAPFVLARIADSAAGPGWLTVDDPDVILLHIGTNGQLTAELDQLLDMITTTRPATEVLVAQIIPKRTYNASIVSYNTFLEGRILPKYQARGARVTLVDHYTPFLVNPTDPTTIRTSYFATGNHPNKSGYERMADIWFDAIQSLPERLVGDYNADGVVDAADYSAWRNAAGTPGATLPNRDPALAGAIGPADYDAWRLAYGAPAASQAVPEPAAAVLLVVSLGGWWAARRGR